MENESFRNEINSKFYTSVLMTQLFEKHKLYNWTYGFKDLKQCGGYSKYFKETDKGKIVISTNFIYDKNNKYKDVKGLILHEIAHALDKNENFHNDKWLKLANSIGMENKYLFSDFKIKKHKIKFFLKCKNGCQKNLFKRTKKRHYCKRHRFYMKLSLNKKFKR